MLNIKLNIINYSNTVSEHILLRIKNTKRSLKNEEANNVRTTISKVKLLSLKVHNKKRKVKPFFMQ